MLNKSHLIAKSAERILAEHRRIMRLNLRSLDPDNYRDPWVTSRSSPIRHVNASPPNPLRLPVGRQGKKLTRLTHNLSYKTSIIPYHAFGVCVPIELSKLYLCKEYLFLFFSDYDYKSRRSYSERRVHDTQRY